MNQPLPMSPVPSASPAPRCLRRFASLGWLMLGLLFAPALLAARIDVSLDRNPVPVNESFTIRFTAEQSPDDDPDFAPLQTSFEVLNQSHSSQFSLVNGHASRRTVWEVQVLAKQAGTLPIPSIAFGKDRSDPFAVTVTHGPVRSKQGGDASLFLEAEAEPKNPYLQAQVILTLRVLSRVQFQGDLGQPDVPDAVVEKLDEDRQYMTVRDGVQFQVDERRYVLFPQKSGRLTIGPVNLTARVGGGFGPFFQSAPRQQRLHSDPINLDVRPVPAQFTGTHWLPAATLTLSETWTPDTLKAPAGEPITRTLTLRAEGAGIGALPELAALDLPPEVKQYQDQPVATEDKTATGLGSQRRQKTALIASHPGPLTVPAVEVPWWNTVTDRMEVARLPARTLTILPGAPPSAPAVPEAVNTPPAGVTPVPEAGPARTAAAATDGRWFWLALLFGSGWLLTALAWGWSRRSRPAVPTLPASAPAHPTERGLVQAVERACAAADPVAARQAVAQWALQRWPEHSGSEREQACVAALGEPLQALNRHLYAASAGDWQGAALAAAVRAAQAGRTATPGAGDAPVLEPLYRG